MLQDIPTPALRLGQQPRSLIYAAVACTLEEAIMNSSGQRTPDRLAPMPHFECGAFDHSATSPGAIG